ncbi:MAG: extracellular solute-binding protein [Ruminiclostridium sp.]|nr:extracellular solute-binding protein [Ruminiclostridium sp.]
MKKSLMKAVTIVLMTALLFTMLIGCGVKDTPKTETSTPKTETTADVTVSKEPVVLKMIEHSNQATNDAIKALNEKFSKKYPNITVESTVVEGGQYVQLMQTRLAAGDVDILEVSTFAIAIPDWAKGQDKNFNAQFIENGDILDITNEPFIKNWDPVAIKNACTYNGKVYGLNIGKVAYNGIFYNKTIFEQNGLKVPETWGEFINVCKSLQSKSIVPMTAGGKDVWPIAMMWSGFVNAFEPDPNAFAKGLWTGERKFNDPKTLIMFDRMAEFASYFEEGVTSVDYASVIGRFVAGKAAMMPDGTWDASQITTADPNFKFGYFAIPGDAKGAQPPQLAGKYDISYGGYAKSPNKTAILQWLDFFSQKENYSDFINAIGFIPTMTGIDIKNDFIKSLDPINQNFQTNFELIIKNPKGVGKYAGFQIDQLKVLGGSIATPKELADLAQKDWDAALALVK